MSLNFLHLSPEELMRIYIEGHPEDAERAFNELFHRYSDRVYVYVLRKLKLRSDAEDVVQKIFLKLHESKHLFNSKFKFEQWLFVIAKTSVIDTYRKRASDVKKIEALFNDNEVHLPLINQDLQEMDLLSQLDQEKKQLLEWKYVDDLTYQEISKIMNKSETSLRKMISRIVLRLKEGGSV